MKATLKPEFDKQCAHSFSDSELIEFLAHNGINLFTNYFNHVAKTEISFPFVAANPSESSLNY